MGADTKTMLLIFIFILSVSTVHAYTIAGYINDSSGDPVDGAGVALDGTTAQEAFDSVSIPTGTIYSGVVFTTSFYTFHSPNPDSFIGVTITQGLIDLIKQKVRGGSYWMKLNSIDITPNPYSVYYAYPSGQSEFKITAGSAMKEGSNTLQIYYTEYPSGALPSAPLPSMRAGVYYYPMHSTSMVSDESGYYSLSAPNGEYSISAGNEGYEPCSPNPISVVVSGADVSINFCLAPLTMPLFVEWIKVNPLSPVEMNDIYTIEMGVKNPSDAPVEATICSSESGLLYNYDDIPIYPIDQCVQSLINAGTSDTFTFTYSHYWRWLKPIEPTYYDFLLGIMKEIAFEDLPPLKFLEYLEITFEARPWNTYTYYFSSQPSIKDLPSTEEMTVVIPRWKPPLLIGALGAGYAAPGFTIIGFGTIIFPPISGTAFAKEVILWGAYYGLFWSAADPDLNYQQIVTPEPIYLPELDMIPESPGKEATEHALDAYINIVALQKTLEKYQGAKAAQDEEWMLIHLTNARDYTAEALANLQLMREKEMLIIEEMQRLNVTMTEHDIQTYKEQIVVEGLPEIEISMLKKLGFSDSDIALITSAVLESPDELAIRYNESIPLMLDLMINQTEVLSNVIEGEIKELATPKSLKNNSITKLEAAKTGDKKIDKKIDRIVEHVQNSLVEELWIDEWHIMVKHSKKVFHEEHTAVEHMQKEIKKYTKEISKLEEEIAKKQAKGKDTSNEEAELAAMQIASSVFRGVTYDLVEADELLATRAIEDAKATPTIDPDKQKKVDHEIEKAEKEFSKALEEISKDKPDKAIKKFEKAWKHAQHAIKHAEKGG